MLIYSELLNAQVDLDADWNNECNIVITHKALVKYISTMEVNIQYLIIKAEREHSVVQCELSSEQYGKHITEFGETVKETLGKFSNYPVMTAQQMAFDRAAIKFLGFPDNVYSVLEFGRNAIPDIDFKDASDTQISGETSSTAQTSEGDTSAGKNEKKTSTGKKIDAKDYKLDFGIFSGSGMTVMEAFEKARKDAKTKAAIDLYLTNNVSEVRENSARYGMIALQKYAKIIGYRPQ